MLKLPHYDFLNADEQVPIVDFPTNKTIVVKGGPGTGKTILALYRAQFLMNMGINRIQLLVYNRPLMLWLEQAINQLKINAIAKTWHSWFYNLYRDTFGENVPEISDYNPNWDEVIPKLLERYKGEILIDHVIIDEAQDFPVHLLRFLNTISKNSTVFADQQQSITPNATSIPDIVSAFEAQGRVLYLSRNYRNTKQIYDLAHLFYTGDKEDIPARSSKEGDKPSLIKADFSEVISKIINYARRDPDELIGVFLPNHILRDKYYQEIFRLASEDLNVEQWNRTEDFSFKKNGIKILTYNTMKGLEFDTVFMPELDDGFFSTRLIEIEVDNKFSNSSSLEIDLDSEFVQKSIPPEHLKKVYVGITRAKNRLYLFYGDENNESFVLEKIMDNDNKELVEFVNI